MNLPCIIDAKHQEFSSYWERLSKEHQSPYKINAAFSELQRTLVSDISRELLPVSVNQDFSFVVVKDNKPLIGCCLIFQEHSASGRTLDFSGLFVTSELDVASLNPSSHNIDTAVFGCLHTHLDSLMTKLQPDLVEFFDSMACGVMSPISHWLLRAGAIPVLCPAQLIDLRGSTQKLVSEVDELSLKAISWGQEKFVFRVCNSVEDLDPSLFSAKQCKEGRFTTFPPDNDKLFLAQSATSYYRTLLDSKKAFIIQALAEGNLIASATFAISKDKAQYIASIVGTSVNAQSVLQSLVWEGMQYARSLGLSWAELTSSERLESDNPFTGFGGVTETRFKLVLAATG